MSMSSMTIRDRTVKHSVLRTWTTYPIKNDAGDVTQVIDSGGMFTTEFSDRWNKKTKEFESNIQKMIQETG